MCRLILAVGDFDAREVVTAATEMCLGLHTTARAPIDRHPHGWGAIWLDQNRHQLREHRSSVDLACDISRTKIEQLETRFLAVHARYASVPERLGLHYTHPIRRPGPVTWRIMHNGFLPTLYERLGYACSAFDSLEYLEYATSRTSAFLYRRGLVDKLEQLPAGGTAGNAFFVNDHRAYAFQWFPKASENAAFYTMHVHETAQRTIVSSEPIRTFGTASSWKKLQRGDLLQFDFPQRPALSTDRVRTH